MDIFVIKKISAPPFVKGEVTITRLSPLEFAISHVISHRCVAFRTLPLFRSTKAANKTASAPPCPKGEVAKSNFSLLESIIACPSSCRLSVLLSLEPSRYPSPIYHNLIRIFSVPLLLKGEVVESKFSLLKFKITISCRISSSVFCPRNRLIYSLYESSSAPLFLTGEGVKFACTLLEFMSIYVILLLHYASKIVRHLALPCVHHVFTLV